MNILRSAKFALYKKLVNKFSKIDRLSVSANYLMGEGIEIGAMDLPLAVKRGVKVRYLDRISKEESAKLFPDTLDTLVTVDIIGDGETLEVVSDDSNDFIIANHFIEHTQNPVLTIKNMLRVVRKGGIIFLAIPDKRFTFDEPRKVTSLDHFVQDYQQGPAWSEHEHYYDFVKHTEHGFNKSDSEIEEVIARLKEMNWSIHFHVWDHQAMIDMFCMMKNQLRFGFEMELAVAASPGGNESIFVLRKS
jgi:predicted SAM-dependent methyltransferase